MMTEQERDKVIAHAIEIRRPNSAKNSIKKWSDEELNLRREAIYAEMGKGKSIMQMCYELAERWGCNQQMVGKYITEARKYLKEASAEHIEEYRAKMIEKLERLAADAEAHNDRKSMLAAYDQISKLSGAYTTKIEADVKEEIKFDFGGE